MTDPAFGRETVGAVVTEAFFLPADTGHRFCLFHAARSAHTLGTVLYVHPFAEEMNKSRRMAALQARALADAGYAVLQIDLLGCGDSSGDFGDASWEGWIDDIGLACRWLHVRAPAPLWLWGLRAGCLLAAEAARRMDAPARLLFWQPSANGNLVLKQFLRLRLAGNLQGGHAKGALDALRNELAQGRTIEVAGYALSPALALGMARATLQPPAKAARLVLLELSAREGAALSAAAAASRAEWEQAGFSMHCEVVNGPAFWQTTEIEEAPKLIRATLAALAEPVAA